VERRNWKTGAVMPPVGGLVQIQDFPYPWPYSNWLSKKPFPPEPREKA
jgi:hypothetical protein